MAKGISFFSALKSAVANATFFIKNADYDEIESRVVLKNVAEAESGVQINNTQRYINELGDTEGITEGDAAAKTYSSHNIIADGDDRKTAMGKLDLQVDANLDKNNAQDVRLTTNESDIDTNTADITTNETAITDISDSIGQPGGIAELDGAGTVPAAQLPSYVDDVLEFADFASLPVTGEIGKIYITLDNNKSYRWSGSVYTFISNAGLENVTNDAQLKRENDDFSGFAESTVKSWDDIVLVEKGVNKAKYFTTVENMVGLGDVTNDAQLKRAGADFNLFTEKAAPVDNDIVLIEDSTSLFSKKKVKLSNMLSGGGGGVATYVENGDAEKTVNDWVVYRNTVAGDRPDDFGGTPNASSAITRNATTPHTGLYSWYAVLYHQGEGAYYPFDINNKDKAQMLLQALAFTEGADDDFRVYLVGSNDNFVSDFQISSQVADGELSDYMQFQTSSDATKYRLCMHRKTSVPPPVALRFEVTSLGASALTSGYVGTDWEDYTPTVSGIAISSSTLTWRRDGTDMIIYGKVTTSSRSGDITIYLPDGKSSTSGATNKVIGTAHMFLGAAAHDGAAYLLGTSSIAVYGDDGSGRWNATIPMSNAAVSISINVRVPIQGWSSTSRISTDFGNREISALMRGNTGETLASTDNIPFNLVMEDSASSWNTDYFEAPETGKYVVSGAARYTANIIQQIYPYIDSGSGYSVAPIIGAEVTATTIHMFNGTVNLTRGDKLAVRATTGGTLLNNTLSHWISITKLATPESMLEGAKVFAEYQDDSGDSIATLGGNTKVTDTHDAYNTSTKTFTAPKSGRLRVNARMSFMTLTGSTWRGFIVITGKSASPYYGYSEAGSTKYTMIMYKELMVNRDDEVTIITTDGAGFLYTSVDYNTFTFSMD